VYRPTSYYTGDGRLRGALGSSVVLIITHVGSAVVPLLAVLLRTELLPVMAHTEAWRGRIGHGLAVAAASSWSC
jgi:hypothetical protein